MESNGYQVGICPVCKAPKEITEQGRVSGQCDDCHADKHTCKLCEQKLTDAWKYKHVPGIGNYHNDCYDELVRRLNNGTLRPIAREKAWRQRE